ncbi:MAG TPA: tripartite tricarboxylate transporter substrate binding protein [Pseudolabrys sp.]|jgi:tripartite-type tricarboxylate transporter receptor subunit TctC|nr:tripartite tricarboxylate transporter substrate binding protein [Pseudolabrys sp.]
MQSVSRRLALTACAAVIAATLSPAFAQSDFPNRPITLMVPLQVATASDLVARVIAQNFGERTGKTMIVENVVGGGGGIGAQRVARARPDGYTLGAFNNGVHTILPATGMKLGFEPFDDFVPVTLLARFPSVLIVNTALPVNTLQDLIALAKKEPGKLSYASVGVGSPQHLAMEQLKADAGIDLLHIPYRGGAQATQAISTGEVNAFWIATSVALPFLQAKTVRALAVGERTRTKALPDVPTVDEAGVKGYEYSPTLALFAPKGTPPEVVAYLAREFTTSLSDPEVIRRLEAAGLEPQASSGAELQASLAAEAKHMAPLVKKLGIGQN